MNRTTQPREIDAQKAQAALQALNEAWAYYTPEPLPVEAEHVADQAEIFHYHNAA